MQKIIFLVSFFALGFGAMAQDPTEIMDKGLVEGDTVPPDIELKKEYDPKRASTLSAIFPGLGQIYNDSWWKAPIIYVGMGTSIYFIDYNNQKRKDYTVLVKELLAKKKNGETINENELRVYRRNADYWRKNRDLVFLTTLAIYGLNIIEASIDAHLKGFNVNDNLANFKPKVGVINNGTTYLGVGVTIPIRSR
ncbi:DUF5683 domain-containing protein [Roseivirga seohaensis]|uniref:DUF5683 domain-containing protein n=1 Tax=Roseivirga seohaensis TaxID=1914963 RepID=UPI00069EADAF|nr:DUF5683 domain-containing protein [Roseivirga seohaensis]